MRHLTLLALAIVLFLAACGSPAAPVATAGPSATDTPGAAATAPAPGGTFDLEGTKWTLVSFGPKGAETPAVSGSAVTLEFQGAGRLGGTGGCNGYGADFQAQGSVLAVGTVVSTMMACADDAVMQQEQQYYQAIQMAGEYGLSGDQLVITYNNGAGVLTFTRQS